MSLLKINDLKKTFAERQILDIPSLELERGKSYLLTGDNGAGKTTLLRILAGLEPAQLGGFHFDGKSIPANEIGRRLAPHVIYLHQHPYLFNTSVASNIAYGLNAAHMPRHRQKTLLDEAMAWADVRHLADVPPHKLSGGEKQRVALARARILNPEVLLLDEPTANLDEAARRQVTELIAQVCDNNRCVLIATHDPELVRLENSTRMRLKDGSLQIS